MRWGKRVLACAVATLAAACVTTDDLELRPELAMAAEVLDPGTAVSAATFAFDPSAGVLDAPSGMFVALKQTEIDQATREAVRRRLTMAGLQETDAAAADVLVSVEASGREAWLMRDVGGGAVTEDRYIDGVLAVSIADAATSAPVWRGSATGPVYAPLREGARVADTVNTIIDGILRPFIELRRQVG